MTPPVFDMRSSIGIVLAGGEGSRLNVLVHRRAKPAVPFGAIYRIIDFSLSNAMHSGLERVGVLTQYMPYSLADHVGLGRAWGFAGRTREAKILPPHTGQRASDWYRGTADAVFRNMSYIRRHSPEYVLILSGDHVYRMDYAALVADHVRAGADATIAVLEVPIADAPNFGTILTDATDRIVGFEEKPAAPRSNLASMGVYVFTRKVLEAEIEEVIGHQGLTDFGQHIFPQMLLAGRHLQAHRFRGYWQDVGTIRAYFDAHMEMLEPSSRIDLRTWKIRTNWDEHRGGDRPPARFGRSAEVDQSIVAQGARIAGKVRRSVLSAGVVVEEGAVVERSILMHDVHVHAGAVVRDAILDKQVDVGAGAAVGGSGPMVANQHFPLHLDSGQAVIGKGSRIPPDAVIERNAILFPFVTLPRGGHSHVRAGQTIGDID